MKTPAQVGERLLAALEELAVQEALLLHAEDYPAILQLQHRAAPLIERLASLAGTVGEEAWKRVAALQLRRRQSLEILAGQMSYIRDELGQTRLNQRRLTRIAPAYGHAIGGARSHFSALG